MTSVTNKGMLYLCATPIGNLEDITYRAIRLLSEADIIAAEDTRHTRQLLSHYDIHTRLVSYHEHNKASAGAKLILAMLSGQTVVCVSDAGLPGIADPGTHLARLAIENGIKISPLPGANAALSALICSGLSTERFTFIGFLPKTHSKRTELLNEIKYHRETLIFYEAPHHLPKTLTEIAAILGNERCAVLSRELTKKFEEFRHGTLLTLKEHVTSSTPRGEYVLLVAGFSGITAKAADTEPTPGPAEMVRLLIEQGLPKKEALREVAKKLHISRRDVYQDVLKSTSLEALSHKNTLK